MRDTLPAKPFNYEIGIINLDSNANPGTHWTMYARINRENFYFDGFGVQPPTELVKYLSKPILYSTFQIQELGTKYCGHLCIYVILQMIRGLRFEEAVLQLLQDFSQNKWTQNLKNFCNAR